MDKVSCRLTVFFEEPFWIGVFERISEGIGTKSQQALKLQQEQLKTERKTVSREQREAEKQRQFELKQQKRKEKHRGR